MPNAKPKADEFTTDQVSRLTGATPRQLQWWDEQEFISPRHEGHRRFYSRAEVVKVQITLELRASGLRFRSMRSIARIIDVPLRSIKAKTYLLTDGESHIVGNAREVVESLANATRPMACVNLSEQLAIVRRVMEGKL